MIKNAQEDATSLLATVRHLMTRREIETCEAYSEGNRPDCDCSGMDLITQNDFKPESVLRRLQFQFPAEIAAHQLASVLAYSREVTATHLRLNPAA